MANSVFLNLEQGEAFVGQLIGPAADNTAAPPFTFLGDLNTGYASSAADTLDLVAGGTSRTRITTASLLLPSGNKLAWGSSAYTTPDAFIYRSGTKAFNIDADGAGAALTSVSVFGPFATTASVTIGGASTFSFDSGATHRSAVGSPADGQLNVTTNATTIGVGLDVATDAILKLRTRAQTGYATLDCLGLKASGSAGASGTGTVVSQITVVNGIVTAITVA